MKLLQRIIAHITLIIMCLFLVLLSYVGGIISPALVLLVILLTIFSPNSN